METKPSQKITKGAEFIIKDAKAEDIFIPEEFSEEQQMMEQACHDFMNTEIFPHVERIEKLEEGLMPSILKKAGDLGLLGVTAPEEYGGLSMNFNTSMLITSALGPSGSFSTTYGAHTGIGTLPILYYGTKEQKEKYLPKLISGEWPAAYCLTEPDAGSDANSGKTKAKLSEDGKYYSITGQKMWISNGGFAELFIVFAKIDDDENLTAFIVEKSFEGITMNDEEEKMGIKGSSTRQVFFTDCKVPVENMLYERGKGFKIAVNVLNIGRIKLAAAVQGASKNLMDTAINYSNERKQFGKSISSFGAIQTKLAKMAVKNYALESANYRAGNDIDNAVQELIESGMSKEEAKLKGVEEFAIESAIMKVHGSEVLDFTVDEGVQIYGGMGYSADAPMERAYRDARISRIYEGTNEINRMLAVGMVFKRAMKGSIDVMTPAMEVAKELTSIPTLSSSNDSDLFDKEKAVLKNLKKTLLMVAGKAAQKFGVNLNDEQEVLLNLADIMIETYVTESVLLRTEKLVLLKGDDFCKNRISAAKLYLVDAVEKISLAAKEAISYVAEGDEQKVMLMGLKRFTKYELPNIHLMRREIAQEMISNNKYCF